MTALTIDTVRDAQANDLDAITTVITETESRIAKLADRAARRMGAAGARTDEYREEFMQVGRVAVWEAVPRFHGDTLDAFFAFIYRTVETALLDAVREERNGGVDKEAMKTFGRMLEEADGDVFLAEKLCQTVPPKGERLSADRAHAARLAWEGPVSLDAPATVTDAPWDGGAVGTVAENVHSTYGLPEDLVTAEDTQREADRVKHAYVTSILDVMGENQRVVIRNSFGIAGCPCFGWGDDGDDYGMSEHIGLTVPKIRDARTKGLKSFAKRWVKVRATSPEHAAELTAAAAENLSPRGRK